ncbi:MAG: carboxypeptidase-like regulatory domain-containing protein [Planctomycetaceae bacterium]
MSWLALAAMLVPSPAWGVAEAEEASSARQGQKSVVGKVPSGTRIQDIRLGSDGALTGRLRDELGRPLPDARVVVSRGRLTIASTRSDEHGDYRITGLLSGVYRVEVATTEAIVRVWAYESAPPQADKQLDLDAKLPAELAVRGQGDDGLDPVHRFGLDGEGGLDSFELALLATSVISLTLSAIMLAQHDELQDSIDRLPASN